MSSGQLTPAVTIPDEQRPAIPTAPANAWANCGAPLAEQYCGSCGQRKPTDQDYSLAHFMKHALHDVTHFDAKIFRTSIPLLIKPGFLTAEFFAGRRQQYVKPLTLFVLLNIAFFFVGHRVGLFNWKLGTYLVNFHWLFQPMIDRKLAAEGLSLDELTGRFNEVAHDLQRWMFFFTIPMLALVLTPFFRKRYFVQHLIYSVHFHPFFLLFCLTALPLFMIVLELVAAAGMPGPLRFFRGDPGLGIPLAAAMLFYHCIALRRVYAVDRLVAFGLALVLTIAEPFIWLYVFRPAIFFVAYASL